MIALADATASFRWQRNSTPLSRPETVAALTVCYLIAVLLLRLLVKKPVPMPVGIAALHNAILCFGSLAMFLGTAYEACKVSSGCHLIHFNAHVSIRQVLRTCQQCRLGGTCANNATQVVLATGSSTWLFCLPKGTPIEVNTAHDRTRTCIAHA